MITLEKLTEFTHENLGYKPKAKVNSYQIVGDWIQLNFDDNIGEVVSIDRFHNWINEKRDEKINQIL